MSYPIMKRRNVDLSKIRRPMKSKKISEGIYTSVFGYIKFLSVWGLVLLADFILEFRFEYLYPVWLLLRTVQDSYKYQGMMLTLLFLAVALGSDILCYVFIPMQWLFFAASSYVWVQYVWHTDRGIGLSTVSLWLLFIYVEAALRYKDHRGLPFNLDLCRPFAAHCIGYPVVTLGYGIKTAASESLRQRTRAKVKKSNHFYSQLLEQALPLDLRATFRPQKADLSSETAVSTTELERQRKDDTSDTSSESSESVNVLTSSSNNINHGVGGGGGNHSNSQHVNSLSTTNPHVTSSTANSGGKDSHLSKSKLIEDFDADGDTKADSFRRRNVNSLNEEAENMINEGKNKTSGSKDQTSKKLNNKRNRGNSSAASATTVSSTTTSTTTTSTTSSNSWSTQANGSAITTLANHTQLANGGTGHTLSKHNATADHLSRLESDMKKLKADLQASRNLENELKSQLTNKSNEDKQNKTILTQLQQDNDTLQNKLHNLVMAKQQDKQNLASLEKKYQDEKKMREKHEQQLASERKAKKHEDQVAAKALALANTSRPSDCIGGCKTKVKDMEDVVEKLKWDMERKDEQIRQLETDTQALKKYKDTNTDKNEVLMSALAAMQDKTAQLETSLSAETKIKLELFSALGDVKRNFELQRRMLAAKDTEIANLRSHIADALALVPSSMYADQSLASGQYTTPKLGSPTMVNCAQPYIPGPAVGQHELMYNPRCHNPPPPQPVHINSHRYSQQELQQHPPTSMVTASASPSHTPTSDTGTAVTSSANAAGSTTPAKSPGSVNINAKSQAN